MSRRVLMKSVGLAAIPVILAITAPTRTGGGVDLLQRRTGVHDEAVLHRPDLPGLDGDSVSDHGGARSPDVAS